MKLQISLLSIISLFLVSCGSSKKTVTYKPRKPKVYVDESVNFEKQKPIVSKEIKLKQVKKPLRITPKNTQEYVLQFAPVAMRKMKEYKIPASITLAQGILESGSGRSPLAIRSNNHFGIKCHKGWKGRSVTHDDDEIGECFRKYKHPEKSYEDHSKFLTSRKRYSKLFRLRAADYKGWAYGLKRAGYATDPRYPQKLIGLIKKYNLTQYDKQALVKKEVEIPQEQLHSAAYYKVKKGDTLYSIARKYNISVKEIKRLNNLTNNNISIGQQLLVY